MLLKENGFLKNSVKSKKSNLRKQIESWFWAIVVVIFLRVFVIQAYRIPTGSMKNTLLPGDFVLAPKFIYGIYVPYLNKKIINFRKPKRGEIVIFTNPLEGPDLVKRCIGIEGDTIEIINKVVYVNGKPLKEPYVIHTDPETLPKIEIPNYQERWERGEFKNFKFARDNFGPIVVPKNTIFVLGDNRDNSYDSRFFGPVNIKLVKGRPFIIYFSYNSKYPLWKFWKALRLKRFFKIVFWS